ncbi:MAG: DUF5916 domain-containing protein [Longimicrobiales bacterium]|nr:DUF5916 domain-containing protein [Longimicrobiales bacterium]
MALGSLLCAPHASVAQETGQGERYPVRGSLSDPDAYPRPGATASRTSVAPVIDGNLDDEVWQRAELITDFIQSQPDPGRVASERTEVRILYDDEALYMGAMNYDSKAGSYVVQTLERDFPSVSTRDADVFGFTLDTFLDRKNSFIFSINPYGAYRDGQTFDDSRNMDFGFDLPADVVTQLRDDGWSVEIRIPWSGIRYDARREEQVFGLNIQRRVRRNNEDSYWAPVQRRDPVHRMSKAGTLYGIRDIPSANNLSAKPYLMGDNQSGSAVAEGVAGTGKGFGGDVKYGVTPGVTLDLTVNTDFSQVDVDQERVNLTRFPLFFPEQRDFFVENSGSFTFGDQSEREYRMGASLSDFTLFHSRAIGLQAGRPVPIVAGGRLSGAVGDWNVGLLDIRTEAADGRPGENFAVLRLRRAVGPGSDVGAMFIDRSGLGDGGGLVGRSYGVDANIHVLGALALNSYVARTETPGATGDETAMRFGAAWRDQTWNISGLYRRIGDDFRPAVGFVRRRDIEHTYVTVGTHRRPRVGFLQEVNPYVEFHRFTDLGDTLVSREVQAGLVLDFMSGAVLTGTASRVYDLVEAPFEVGDGVVPAGGYEFDEASLVFQSSAGRPFSADLSVRGGGYYHGERRSVGAGLRWLVNHQLALTGSADYNRLGLADGRVTTSVYSGRIKYAFSTRAFMTLNVQYNQDVDQLVTYGRFNVIHGPLSDFFLVLSERRQLGTAGGVLERVVTAKVTKLLSF